MCMASMYDKMDLENYKYWEDDILSCAELRRKYPIVVLTHNCHEQEDGFDVKCPKCNSILRAQFGKYNRALDQKAVICPNGDPESGHGWWASVINLVLN